MLIDNVIPKPGHALVGLRPVFNDFRGGPLVIPERARSLNRMGRVGQVCAITPYPEGQLSWVYECCEEVAREAWRHNAFYMNMLGKFVVCRSVVHLFGILYSVRLEHIESVVPQEASADDDELGRCRTCRPPQGELGVLLGPDGYCPQCGFNVYGEHIDEQILRPVEEWELDHFVRQPAEVAHVMETGGKAIHGRVISYPGQRHRGTVTPADDRDLNEFMRNMRRKG